MTTQVVVNIDADPICYAIGSLTNEHPFVKDDEGKPIKIPIEADQIMLSVDNFLNKILESTGCTEYKLFISGSTNFRNEVAVTYPYKGSRSGVERPALYQQVKNYILSKKNTQVSDNREADDDVADAQTKDTILASIDKDLDNVPGLHYNWYKEDKGVYFISEEEAFYNFCKQLLTGDWSTDCILGCAKLVTKTYGPKAQRAGEEYQRREGIGPKQAESILADCFSPIEMLDTIFKEYKKMYGNDAEAVMNEMGTLLYMGGSADNLWTYTGAREWLLETGLSMPDVEF